MTECRTPEMQDLLPDYVSAVLDATAAALVERHLSICDPCRDDVAVLRLARAVRPTTRPVDVAQIVATLPRPTPTLRLVRTASDAPPSGTAPDDSSTTVSDVDWSESIDSALKVPCTAAGSAARMRAHSGKRW